MPLRKRHSKRNKPSRIRSRTRTRTRKYERVMRCHGRDTMRNRCSRNGKCVQRGG